MGHTLSQGQLSFDFSEEEQATAEWPSLNISINNSSNYIKDGIFGWYQYIQDFPGSFALEWLKAISRPDDIVWDPFSGSGTTLVAAKLLERSSYGYDLNPFMVDVTRVKTDWAIDLDKLRWHQKQLEEILAEASLSEPEKPVLGSWIEYSYYSPYPFQYPNDEKLHKWISPGVLARLMEVIQALSIVPSDIRSFFRVALAGVIIPASNMKFRPNICYEGKPVIDYPVVNEFLRRVEGMIEDLNALSLSQVNRDINSTVCIGDARIDGPNLANVIFTSPPYPNDMEYVHQTRLELMLLDYYENSKQLTALKKNMISSSVKLVYKSNEWQKEAGLQIKGVNEVFQEIALTLKGKNWGWNAADMTAQYFGGMRKVLANWNSRLAQGGQAAVVIGDSAFNGIKIHTDELLAECAALHGFSCEGIEPFRRRWNSKHKFNLRESVVVLKKTSESASL